eukprot:Nk52_evm37s2340 gene=Nk52_evmTU37s2340
MLKSVICLFVLMNMMAVCFVAKAAPASAFSYPLRGDNQSDTSLQLGAAGNSDVSDATSYSTWLLGVDENHVSTFSVDNCWYGFDIIKGNLILRKALKDGTKSATQRSMTTAETYSLYTSASSYQNAVEAKSKISASYLGFGGNVNMDYTRDVNRESKSIILEYYINLIVKTRGIEDLTEDILLPEALNLWNSDPIRFYETYGTHTISEVHYGCDATLDGQYSFSSSDEKERIAMDLDAQYHGVAKIDATASISSTATQKSTSSSFQASVQGDIDSFTVKDRNSLDSWMDAISDPLTGFRAQCQKGTTLKPKKIRIVAWASFLPESKSGKGDAYSLTDDDFRAITAGATYWAMARVITDKAFKYYISQGMTENSPPLSTWVRKGATVCSGQPYKPPSGELLKYIKEVRSKSTSTTWYGGKDGNWMHVTADTIQKYHDEGYENLSALKRTLASAVTKMRLLIEDTISSLKYSFDIDLRTNEEQQRHICCDLAVDAYGNPKPVCTMSSSQCTIVPLTVKGASPIGFGSGSYDSYTGLYTGYTSMYNTYTPSVFYSFTLGERKFIPHYYCRGCSGKEGEPDCEGIHYSFVPVDVDFTKC